MNVLAFDTCFGACSVALTRAAVSGAGARDVVWRYETMATGHAERLMPMIEEVLAEAGGALTDIDVIAVTEGPGTFTGLRVGVAAARGLALAAQRPIRATTSLHVMGQQAIAELQDGLAGRALAVCMDARAGQVFIQYIDPATGDPFTAAELLLPDQAVLRAPQPEITCVGSGALAFASAAAELGYAVETALPDLQPDARALAALAPRLSERKPLLPLYLRLPDAKPQLGKSLPRA